MIIDYHLWFCIFTCSVIFIYCKGGMLVEEDHLRNITHLFYRTEYEEGITEITTFIQQNPGNSNLYTNRALFLAQLDKD